MKPKPVAVIGLLILLLVPLSSPVASSVGVSHDVSRGALYTDGEATNVAPMSVAYRFDSEGLLSLADASALPIAKGTVNAHWFEHQGWAVVVFAGLDLEQTGPLCLGVSAIDATSGLVTQVAFAPTAAGACDDDGAGRLPPASPDSGVRSCTDVVAFVTRIAAENGGPVTANAVVFPGDGTGIGVSGRLDAPSELTPLDAAIVDCGPLPQPRQQVPATPAPVPTPLLTPAPASQGVIAAIDRAPAPEPASAPIECPVPARDGLEDIFATPAGPYLLKHPVEAGPTTATIIFLPGGGGSYGAAQRVWQTAFERGAGFDDFRIVIPYAVDADLIDEATRVYGIVDEMLACYGGDSMKVHLAGASNGGLAAFGLMVREPTRFASLLGAPGAFPVQDPTTIEPEVWLDLLAGRAVFNGVGEFDAEWRPEVVATHNVLAAAGVESVFEEFGGQGHVMATGFDSTVLLDFWESRE